MCYKYIKDKHIKIYLNSISVKFFEKLKKIKKLSEFLFKIQVF
jgi:hypothetical protein